MSTVCWGACSIQAKLVKVGMSGAYVICVHVDDGYGDAISCNWEAYNKREEKKGRKHGK